jgi:hypothetical protein
MVENKLKEAPTASDSKEGTASGQGAPMTSNRDPVVRFAEELGRLVGRHLADAAKKGTGEQPIGG